MRNQRRIKTIIIISIVILIIAVVLVYIFTNNDQGEAIHSSAQPISESVPADAINSFNYTEPELREIIFKLATERFGEDAYVIPLNTDGPSQAEIDGQTRYIYIYAADSLTKQEDDIKGLYHVDPVTGEIFDNGSGKMEKVNLEDDLNEE